MWGSSLILLDVLLNCGILWFDKRSKVGLEVILICINQDIFLCATWSDFGRDSEMLHYVSKALARTLLVAKVKLGFEVNSKIRM